MTVLTAFAELAQDSSVYVPGLGLRARFKRVAASWLALKTWVKVWLTFLNVVLFAGFGFLDDPLALWTLVSLPVTGVLLVGMALAMGGLNRLVGLGHLLPWVPLALYLDVRLVSDLAGPRIDAAASPALFAWALTLGLTLSLCLALDAWDVMRWLRGERYVLGTEAAHKAGASRLSPTLADG
jgi:hypothetical protein